MLHELFCKKNNLFGYNNDDHITFISFPIHQRQSRALPTIMTLFVLAETSAGYALFKAKDKKLLKRDDLDEATSTAEGTCSLLKMKEFAKFDSAATALEEMAGLVEGKVTPMLSKLLDSIKDEKKATLAVADPKLGGYIERC